MSDQCPIISQNSGELQPNCDIITSDNEPVDNPSLTSCSDSELSDIPSSKSARPLSLVNPTSVFTPPLSSTIDYRVLSDFKRIATSLTISSSGSSNFEISDYEGDCSSDGRTPSPALDCHVVSTTSCSCDVMASSEHDSDVITSLLPSRQMRVIEERGEDVEDRSTTSPCEGERHEVAPHPPPSPLLGGLKYFLPDQAERLREHYAALAAQETRDSEGQPSPTTRYSHHTPCLLESQETLVHRSTALEERTARMSYISRALALARPTSPPPAYKSSSQPTVLTLRSYFNFAQVNSRPRSAPHSRYRPRYDPGDMVNEPYTLQPTHIVSHGSPPQHLEQHTPNFRLSNTTIMSEPVPALAPLIQTSSRVSCCHSNSYYSGHSGMVPNQSQSSVEAYSPFTRRRNEDPYFGLHLLENNQQSYCYRSNPEGLCHRSNPCDPRHLGNPGSEGPHSATPPCSYNTRRVGPVWSHGYICHGFVESLPSTPLPPLVVDTQVVNPEDALPPPYSEGDFTSLVQAPRYSEVVNTCYLRGDSFFHRNNAFACMGSVRTLAIGITLCCCGVVFLMVTYVFGAVSNPYLGYLGVLQVIVGLTMILLVAIYNSGRFDFINLIKTYSLCPGRRGEGQSRDQQCVGNSE
ncbi:hypothetical protein ACHWQZ_G000924 [Mnemiopsis leidyi]